MNVTSQNVLIITTSLRSSSNSDMLAEVFADGAKAAGHHTEIISLKDKNIAFCKGCLACQKTGSCVIKDDAVQITEKMKNADVIVWATPIYYYEMSGQMKTMIDRANSLYSSDYSFRDVYLLSAAAENGTHTDERAVIGLGGWIACFDKARFAGKVFAGGVNAPADISEHSALKEAYELGKSI